MTGFKFFQPQKRLLSFEIVHNLKKSRHCNMYWSLDYSIVVKEWVSNLYYTNTYRNVNRHLEYFNSIDRTCELMCTPEVLSVDGIEEFVSIRVKIWCSNEDWMVLDIVYPIQH